MEKLTYELKDDVAVITMDDGKANAFSSEMFEAVNAAFDQAEKEAKIVVFRGREGIFSGGYDLKELAKLGPKAGTLVRRGSELVVRIMECSLPVITVGTGHVVAMGASIFLGADYRIGVDGAFKVGLPETANGLPMHNFGREVAIAKLPQNYFSRAFINGEMYLPKDAVAAGYLDKVVAPGDLNAAIEEAVSFFKSVSLHAFSLNKPMGYKTLLPDLKQAIEDDFNHEINI